MLDPAMSRLRQKRLLDRLSERRLDAAVLGDVGHVQYLTSHRPFWLHHVGLVIFSDGRSVLIAPEGTGGAIAADEIRTYEATWNGTQRQEQPRLVADTIGRLLAERKASRIGIDCSEVTAALDTTDDDPVRIDEDLRQIRRRKDADELALMRTAIGCTRAMYERAGQIIQPGVAEIDVFNELHAAAVRSAGEPLSAHLGNDYACGVPGGPPRHGRRAAAGEIYILDLGPAVRGYFADNCRAFSVGRHPTDAQIEAWRVVTGVFPIIEKMARPGVRCRDIFQAVDDHYRGTCGRAFPHHLGHGVGLQPHEYPHLNPKWDDTLLEGEVFTVEPGLYSPELAGGLRIENQYVVRADGVENLTPFPTELA